MKKHLILAAGLICLALASSSQAGPIPGVTYSLVGQFDTNSNPSPSGWQYSESLANGGGIVGAWSPDNWNSPDFGAGQPGWLGHLAGAHAGWAKRVDNGTLVSSGKDAPVGTVMTHGPTSALLRFPVSTGGGTVDISGGLWNLRTGRSGTWAIYKNDDTATPITVGLIDEYSGSSSNIYSFANGANGPDALTNIAVAPGDTIRFAQNENDFTGVVLDVTVFTDPWITADPQSLTVPKGSPATFTVAAGGTTALSYQWRFNSNNISGATSATYTIPSADGTNTGTYDVVVTDTAGSITSRSVSLLVQTDLYISSQPSPDTKLVNSGSIVSYSVGVGGTPPFFYKWMLNGVELSDDASFSGSSSDILNIHAATNIAGAYSVRVWNSLGHTNVSSSVALNVYPPIPVFPGWAHDLAKDYSTAGNPNVAKGWSFRTRLEWGGTVIAGGIDPNWNSGDFGPGQPGYDGTVPGVWAGWAKRVDNGTIGNTPNGNKDAPVGSMIGYRSGAVWQAPATDPGGVAYIAGGIWNMRKRGQSGTWSIHINENSTPITQGTINDQLGDSAGPTSFELGTGGAAALQAIPYVAGDTFRIECAEDEFIGVVFTVYTVSDPGISQQPTDLAVPQGSTATFSVTAFGTGTLTYQWQHEGTNLPSATSATLVLNNVQAKDGGLYQVVVKNGPGATIVSEQARLTVQTDLYLTSQPIGPGRTLNTGQILNLSAGVAGTPPFFYQWQVNGNPIPGATNNPLALSVTTNHIGAVRLVVSNTLNHTVTSDSVSVDVYPAIPVYPGYAHDAQAEFSSIENPTTHDWQYSESPANGSTPVGPYVANWNSPDFGPGQPGWQGVKVGAHAGYAKRIDNGYIGHEGGGVKDAPVGTVMTHGPTSIQWTAGPGDPGGIANIAGGIWNLRKFTRSGNWFILKNGNPITTGPINDSSGDSSGPMNFAVAGDGGFAALENIPYVAGDVFTLFLAEEDFQGFRFTVYTQTDPMVTTQPPESLLFGPAGGSISIAASGGSTLSYQWMKDGNNLNGKTSATLSLSGLTPGDNGRYACKVTDSAGSIMSYPTILTVDATPPGLVSAARDFLNDTVVTVKFSEPVTPATANNAANYTINDNAVSGAALAGDGVTVTLTTPHIFLPGTFTLKVSNVQDLAGNPIPANSQIAISVPSDLAFGPAPGGDNLIVVEAESYSQNLSPSADGHSWVFVTTPSIFFPSLSTNITYSGTGVMEAQPNTGVNNAATTVGPELDYKVYIATPGTYYSYVRGLGDSTPYGSSTNDSVIIGIDGTATTAWTGYELFSGYTWGNAYVSGLTSPLVVSTPGIHVLNVWMREDGFDLDKIVLSTNPGLNLTNAAAGVGPAESIKVSGPISVEHSGNDLILTWPSGGVLQAAPFAAGTYTNVTGASSPYPVSPTGPALFYRVKQ